MLTSKELDLGKGAARVNIKAEYNSKYEGLIKNCDYLNISIITLCCDLLKNCLGVPKNMKIINCGVAPITQLRTCVIKIVSFKGVDLCGKSDFPYHKELLLKERIR